MTFVPPGYELITRDRVTLAVHDRYRDILLNQGIDNPEKLLQQASGTATALGRGAVPSFAIQGLPGERMMMRKYLRGGLMRFINRDLYLDGQRSFRELAVTAEAARHGVPTVEVLAAVSLKAAGLLYRCFLFSKELPGCIDLPAFLQSRAAAATFMQEKRAALERAAGVVWSMHDRGFYHADLNMKNILVDTAAPERIYVIDWDKSYLAPSLPDAARTANVVRFCRSMIKLAAAGVPVHASDTEIFLHAYRDDAEFVWRCRQQLRRSVAIRSRFWKIFR